MDKYVWFYVIVMFGMIIINAIQLKKAPGRDVMNWIQITIYGGTVIWYVFCLLGLQANWFLLGTSIGFLLALLLETWQCAANQNREFWDYLFLFIALVPMLLSLGLFSGTI